MSKLQELIAQREALDTQITELSQAARNEGITKAKALIAEHQLTHKDLFGGTGAVKKDKTTGKVVKARYLNPKTGEKWSGRGLAPKWIKEFKKEDRKQFLIV